MITVLLPKGTSSGLAGSAGHSRHNMRESKSHLNWLIVRTSEGTQDEHSEMDRRGIFGNSNDEGVSHTLAAVLITAETRRSRGIGSRAANGREIH